MTCRAFVLLRQHADIRQNRTAQGNQDSTLPPASPPNRQLGSLPKTPACPGWDWAERGQPAVAAGTAHGSVWQKGKPSGPSAHSPESKSLKAALFLKSNLKK